MGGLAVFTRNATLVAWTWAGLLRRVSTLADFGRPGKTSPRNARLFWISALMPTEGSAAERPPGRDVAGVIVGGSDRYRDRAASAVGARVGNLGFRAAEQRTAANVDSPASRRSGWRERVRGFIGWPLRSYSGVAPKGMEGRRRGCLHSPSRANIRKTSRSALGDAGSSDEEGGPNQ